MPYTATYEWSDHVDGLPSNGGQLVRAFAFAPRSPSHVRCACVLLAWVLAVLLARTAAAHENTEPLPHESRPILRFGGDANYPPFEFLDQNGQPAGFQIDLIRAIARTMGLSAEIRLDRWDSIRKGFVEGEIDVIGMFVQPERREYADFTEPHTTNGSEFFIRFGSPKVLGFDDLNGKEIIVQSGALAEEVVRARGIGATFVPVADEATALRLLASGKHDVAIVTQYGGRRAMREFGLKNITTSGPLILASDYALAVRKGDRELLDTLNQGLEILKQTGEYNRIYQKWLGDLDRPAVSLRTVLAYGFWIVGPLLFLALLMTAWNRSLRVLVDRRTGQLRRELHDRLAAQAALQRSETRWRTMIQHAPEAILVLDRTGGKFVEANENACQLLRMDRSAFASSSLVELLAPAQPDGSTPARLVDDWLDRTAKGESLTREVLLRDTHGKDMHCEFRLVEMPGEQSNLLRVSITDITDRKKAEMRQRHMMSELDHRTKNTLATVCGLCDQMATQSLDVPTFQHEFRQRLQALARAHEALAEARWSGVSLRRAVESLAGPMASAPFPRIEYLGDDVQLGPDSAAPVCMAINELATNALKHGALRGPQGNVRVHVETDDPQSILIRWVEHGPAHADLDPIRGYGLSLIQGLVEYQLGGSLEFISGEHGISSIIRLPKNRIATAAPIASAPIRG